MLSQIEHDLWFRSAEFETLSWLFDLLFSFSYDSLEVFLLEVSYHMVQRGAGLTNLKLISKVVHVAAILVVLLRVAPDEAHFLLEGTPCLEVGDVGRRCTSMNAFRSFLDALQGYWMTDDLVVVLKSSGWQVAKWTIYLKASVLIG